MGMFHANEQKSSKNRALVRAVIDGAAADGADYTAAYGYYMKSGLFSQKMYSYAVGFQTQAQKLLLVPINSDGEAGEALALDRDGLTAVKKTMQGGFRLTTPLSGKPIELIVPAYVPDSGESAYQLPINQEAEAAAFLELMKSLL